MDEKWIAIQESLRKKSDLTARLNLIPYEGTPEIKENSSGKYLYIRKRELGKVTSKYVDKYSDELFQVLLKGTKEARALRKEIRLLEKELARLGYSESVLAPEVLLNLDFARANMKTLIYDQTILEGVGTTFPQTETILENGKVSGVSAEDVQKILNLKHAWEFILDKDVIQAKTDFYVLSYIARLVNEGLIDAGGRIRGVPVKIGGSNYIPPLPLETSVREHIEQIVMGDHEPIEVAIELCLFAMKTQIFLDGNKRAAVLFANHYLIGKGKGLIAIPYQDVSKFKKLLIDYYEDKDVASIKKYMKDKCWRKIE
ncbi:MAG: Fic family protein [Firmicutes bacterium]|nr:Fic family protein [Bacillota bacterium]